MNVTLGRYIERNGVLNALDPRLKLLSLLLYIASLYYFSGAFTLLFSFIVLVALVYISRIPVSYIVKGIVRMIPLFIVFALLIVITEENGWRKAGFTVLRLVLTVLSSTLLSLTTKPLDIAGGIEKAVGKGKLKKGAHILSTVIMIAFRFLPILQEEAERIIDAQTSRGCSFDDRGIRAKAKAVLPVLVPLFVSAYRRADSLALAMDARGYNENGSTRLYELEYSRRDYAGYVFLALYCVICFVLERFLWI